MPRLHAPTPPVETIGNNLLGALRPEDYREVHPLLEPFRGKAGDVLFAPGDILSYAFFPADKALVSYRIVLPDGRMVETALTGREGAVGGIVSHGRLPAYACAMVQFPGEFYRLPLGKLEALKARSASLNNLFARYADCLLAQIFQSTACNATHTIEQRSAKWLLSTIDRTGHHEISLTQEQLGGLLGVGRSYVSRIIQRLKREGVVHTLRARLVVDDRKKLREMACDCDLLVRQHFNEVLRGIYPVDGHDRER